jgi:aminoglycoside 6-adenylyltransferase
MEPAMPFYLPELEKAFVLYALSQDNLRAAVVVGSQARRDRPADQWSDLDLLLFCRDPRVYQDSINWIEALAPVWLAISGRTVSGDPERLVVFAGGAQVDFVFNADTVLLGLPEMIARGDLPDTVRRGVRVLFDKDNRIPPLPPPSPLPAQAPPGPEDFRKVVEGFWFSAVYAAKQFCRSDLAFFKANESGLKNQLLPMLEWHARAQYGWNYDTWHQGRFTAEWADPRANATLAKTYARFDPAESWQAFLELLDLFRWLASETAEKQGFEIPAQMNAVYEYIRSMQPA